jgi:predicted Rossmann-fold nucleotide-binding protein
MTAPPEITEKIITVFGSSRPREGEPDYEDARALGSALAGAGFSVCTGGYGGMMAAVSRGAKNRGGKTYGVTAEFFTAAKANPWIDVEVRVHTWQDRLFELIRLGHFWEPIIDRVREVELAHQAPWGEAGGRLIHRAATPGEVASYLSVKLK